MSVQILESPDIYYGRICIDAIEAQERLRGFMDRIDAIVIQKDQFRGWAIPHMGLGHITLYKYSRDFLFRTDTIYDRRIQLNNIVAAVADTLSFKVNLTLENCELKITARQIFLKINDPALISLQKKIHREVNKCDEVKRKSNRYCTIYLSLAKFFMTSKISSDIELKNRYETRFKKLFKNFLNKPIKLKVSSINLIGLQDSFINMNEYTNPHPGTRYTRKKFLTAGKIYLLKNPFLKNEECFQCKLKMISDEGNILSIKPTTYVGETCINIIFDNKIDAKSILKKIGLSKYHIDENEGTYSINLSKKQIKRLFPEEGS